ncbi:MAG: proline--tRNA ligase [Bacillota bacterium]
MQCSRLFLPTLKGDQPRLTPWTGMMVRAGMIRFAGDGGWYVLPSGRRVFDNIICLFQTAFSRVGAHELLFHGHDVLPLLSQEIRSYKMLPFAVQRSKISTTPVPKPSFGLAFAQHRLCLEMTAAAESKSDISQVESAIQEHIYALLSDLGVCSSLVSASPGEGQWMFVLPYDKGEIEWYECSGCDQKAVDWCVDLGSDDMPVKTEAPKLTRIYTPGANTMATLCEQVGIPLGATLKTMVYVREDGMPVLAMVRGDREVDVRRLTAAAGGACRPAMQAEIEEITGAPCGFAGPCNLPRKALLVLDSALACASDLVAGANEADYHLAGLVPGRDFAPDVISTIRRASPKDRCMCGCGMSSYRGFEVVTGSRFSLTGMKVQGRSATLQELPALSVSVDVNRVVDAAARSALDDRGFNWPRAAVPFHCAVIAVTVRETSVLEEAVKVYTGLQRAGLHTLLDDRDAGLGAKMADADLLGIPLRVLIGPQGLQHGYVEITYRTDGEREKVSLSEAVDSILKKVQPDSV